MNEEENNMYTFGVCTKVNEEVRDAVYNKHAKEGGRRKQHVFIRSVHKS